MAMLRTSVAVAVACALCRLASGETFKNQKTGEVLSGKVLGSAHKDGQEGFFVRTSEKKPRTLFLPKAEWQPVSDETQAQEPSRDGPARPSKAPAK